MSLQTPYEEAVVKANSLRELRMNINVNNRNNWKSAVRRDEIDSITAAVRNMMLREGSVLRVVGIGTRIYRVSGLCIQDRRCISSPVLQGRWVHQKDEDGANHIEFEIVSNVVKEGQWDRS